MSIKRRAKLFGSTVGGAGIGFITGNIPGAVIGGVAGYRTADYVLDKNGNNKLYKKLF
jgi:uncharacterized membrane protein